jgi:hypothetical protein
MKGLEDLADSLAAHPLPLLSVDRARSIRQFASRELAGSPVATKPVVSHPLRSGELPDGYSRELVRILAWALLPLPLVVFR